jgi:hypothetical protein
MSILADSLGPSYPFGALPSLQGDDPMSTATLFPGLDCQKSAEVHVPEKLPTVRRDETLLSDNQTDGSLDSLSGLVDFELFEQAMQSEDDDDDDTSRNNQAPADFDANVLLSSYQQLLDAQALPASPPLHPAFCESR